MCGGVLKCEASPAEVRCPSGSQSKWKLGMQVCRCRWTMLVSLGHTGVLLIMLACCWLCWHVADYAGMLLTMLACC